VSAAHRSALTPRQADIAALLQEKRSNKVIAKELGISHFTVRNHITVLMLLLDVDKRGRIPEQAITLGLIEPPNLDARQN
jgi:two-component system, NarL family, nitrate/nitrite response regulator NarL